MAGLLYQRQRRSLGAGPAVVFVSRSSAVVPADNRPLPPLDAAGAGEASGGPRRRTPAQEALDESDIWASEGRHHDDDDGARLLRSEDFDNSEERGYYDGKGNDLW